MGLERDIDHLIKLIASVAEAFTAALFLPAERQGQLTLAACHSLSPHIRYDCVVEVGSGLVGWVAANGEPVTVSDFKPDTTTLGFYRIHEDIKSFLAVPVPLGERRGVLAIDSKRSYVFPPRMQKLMILFAEHVGRLVDNASIQSVMVQTTTAIEKLHAICARLSDARSPKAVIECVLSCPPELVEADAVALALVEDGSEACRVVGVKGESMPSSRKLEVSLKQSLAGWVIRNGKALALADCREYYTKTFVFSPEEPFFGLRSFLGVPLAAGGETLGVLAFLGKRPGVFREAEASTARLLAAQAATALRASALARSHWTIAYHDPATGLPNARHLREHGTGLLERASAEGHPVACLMLAFGDLDELRLSAGGAQADEALRRAAAICIEGAGEKNFVGRDDQGRFVILLRRAGPEKGRAAADRLLMTIERAALGGPGRPEGLSATCGVAAYPEEATNLDALIARAAKDALERRGARRVRPARRLAAVEE